MAPQYASPARRPWRDYALFAAFVAPNLLLLFAFVYKPLVEGIWLSFFEWDLISPERTWVGLTNYREYFADATSRYIARNTLVFAIGSVAGSMTLGLGLALLLNQKLVLRNAIRTILFAPYVVSGAAIGVVWLFIFDPRLGLVAALLAKIGLPSPDWFNDPNWAMPMVIIAYVWKNLGYTVVVFLAGLQSIPQDLYEAARVDGAGAWSRLRNVTLPMLSPVSLFVLVTNTLSSMQAFDLIRVMTQGGPLNATKTMNYQLYEEGFVRFHVGTASAVATVLFLILLATTVVQLRTLDRRVHYS